MTSRLLAALLAPLLLTQGTFEGRLRMRTIELQLDEPDLKESWLDFDPAKAAAREDADVEEAELQLKNNVLRFENKTEGKGYGLLDFGKNVLVVISPESHKYFEMPLPAGSGAATATRPGSAAVKPLGRTRTINGLNTTGYEVRSEDRILRAWMTKDLPGLTGTFRSFAARMGDDDDPDDAAAQELMRYGFPVLMITLTDGAVRYEELVKVEGGTLSPDLFKVPAGYSKQTFPGGP